MYIIQILPISHLQCAACCLPTHCNYMLELSLDFIHCLTAVDSKVEHGLFKSVDSSDSHNYSCELPDLHDGSHCSIQQWNPMEVDFLASKNNYAYDEEDASVAIQGYSECVKRVCMYLLLC